MPKKDPEKRAKKSLKNAVNFKTRKTRKTPRKKPRKKAMQKSPQSLILWGFARSLHGFEKRAKKVCLQKTLDISFARRYNLDIIKGVPVCRKKKREERKEDTMKNTNTNNTKNTNNNTNNTKGKENTMKKENTKNTKPVITNITALVTACSKITKRLTVDASPMPKKGEEPNYKHAVIRIDGVKVFELCNRRNGIATYMRDCVADVIDRFTAMKEAKKERTENTGSDTYNVVYRHLSPDVLYKVIAEYVNGKAEVPAKRMPTKTVVKAEAKKTNGKKAPKKTDAKKTTAKKTAKPEAPKTAKPEAPKTEEVKTA